MLDAYTDLFAAYRAAVQSCGGADYQARQTVYAEIARAVGRQDGHVFISQHTAAIKAELDRIEREETGRETGDDWRVRE
jgi:hypothetical protein